MSLSDVVEEEKIKTLRLRGRLDRAGRLIGFITSKTAGAAAFFGGVVENIDPTVIALVIPEPTIVAGVGLALIAGKAAARIAVAMLKGISV